MLPKLEGKNLDREIIPYKIINRDIQLRNERNNINKLKQLKAFLEEESIDINRYQEKNTIPFPKEKEI
jgi:hypothetical protein